MRHWIECSREHADLDLVKRCVPSSGILRGLRKLVKVAPKPKPPVCERHLL